MGKGMDVCFVGLQSMHSEICFLEAVKCFSHLIEVLPCVVIMPCDSFQILAGCNHQQPFTSQGGLHDGSKKGPGTTVERIGKKEDDCRIVLTTQKILRENKPQS